MSGFRNVAWAMAIGGMLLSECGVAGVAHAANAGKYIGIINDNPFGLKTAKQVEAGRPRPPDPPIPVPPPPDWVPKVRLSQVTELGSGKVRIGFVFTLR